MRPKSAGRPDFDRIGPSKRHQAAICCQSESARRGWPWQVL